MKKISIALIVALLLVTLLSIPVLAATPIVSISASSNSVVAGETITYTVKVSNCSSTSLGIIPDYDTNCFELVSGEWLVSGAAMSDFSDGCAVIAYMENYNFSGDVFRFVLKAKTNAGGKNCTVKCDIQAEGYSASNPSCSTSVTCNHTYGNWTKVDDSKHSHTCTKCNNVETSAHTWDGGKVTKAATCKEQGTKEYTCTECGAKKTETIPTSDGHQYGTATKVDDSKHSHTCSICNKTENASHNWTVQSVTKKATCNETGTQTLVCKDCGATKEETVPKSDEHKYGIYTDCGDGTHKRTCEICGNVETESHTAGSEYFSNSTSHWHECEKCQAEMDKESHGACEICGHIENVGDHTHTYSSTYEASDNGHYHICTICGEKEKVEAHVYDNDCDPDCNVCGRIRIVKHSFSDNWVSDSASHYKECEGCGIIKGKEVHTFVDGKCTVCGYEEETDTEPKIDNESNLWWLWILIGLVVGVGGCAGAYFVAIKPKRQYVINQIKTSEVVKSINNSEVEETDDSTSKSDSPINL